jgi:hypothetical protein
MYNIQNSHAYIHEPEKLKNGRLPVTRDLKTQGISGFEGIKPKTICRFMLKAPNPGVPEEQIYIPQPDTPSCFLQGG